MNSKWLVLSLIFRTININQFNRIMEMRKKIKMGRLLKEEKFDIMSKLIFIKSNFIRLYEL
jgi:hypothetical protein